MYLGFIATQAAQGVIVNAHRHSIHAKRFPFRSQIWAIALAALITLLGGVAALAAPSTPQAGPNVIYIPSIRAGTNRTPRCRKLKRYERKSCVCFQRELLASHVCT